RADGDFDYLIFIPPDDGLFGENIGDIVADRFPDLLSVSLPVTGTAIRTLRISDMRPKNRAHMLGQPLFEGDRSDRSLLPLLSRHEPLIGDGSDKETTALLVLPQVVRSVLQDDVDTGRRIAVSDELLDHGVV